MSQLTAKNISMSFDSEKILEDISLTLKQGEIVSLLGVSGSGKTTLFNVLSGIYTPDEGIILLDSEDITGKPGKISYMLQKDLLLPHYTIIDNVSLPLVIRGEKKKDARKKADALFPEFGIDGSQKKYPDELSGGMRQRAALLRTYLSSSGVALLDEPFSALDTITKSAIHKWYLDIMKKIRLSTIFVTHDIDEAILLSDRIFILSGKPGRITDEIEITLPKPRSGKDTLSEDFIKYKKIISEKIAFDL